MTHPATNDAHRDVISLKAAKVKSGAVVGLDKIHRARCGSVSATVGHRWASAVGQLNEFIIAGLL